MLKYVETKNAPAAIGPYSQGIVCSGLAFFSGQIPLSPDNRRSCRNDDRGTDRTGHVKYQSAS